MLSRTLASQSLRRSLFASSKILARARQLPKYVRPNSSTTDKPRPRRRDEASLDAWVPPVLTYDQVKPKTYQPSPVRFHYWMSISPRNSRHALGFVSDRCAGARRGDTGLDPLVRQHPPLRTPQVVVYEAARFREGVRLQETEEGPRDYLLLQERCESCNCRRYCEEKRL